MSFVYLMKATSCRICCCKLSVKQSALRVKSFRQDQSNTKNLKSARSLHCLTATLSLLPVKVMLPLLSHDAGIGAVLRCCAATVMQRGRCSCAMLMLQSCTAALLHSHSAGLLQSCNVVAAIVQCSLLQSCSAALLHPHSAGLLQSCNVVPAVVQCSLLQ